MANYSRRHKNISRAFEQVFNFVIDTFTPSVITQLHFTGLYAGSEFLTYAATKLYIAEEFYYTKAGAISALAPLAFYDNANALKLQLSSTMPYWNSTAAAVYYHIVPGYITNFWFSRILGTQTEYIQFTGYRITY